MLSARSNRVEKTVAVRSANRAARIYLATQAVIGQHLETKGRLRHGLFAERTASVSHSNLFSYFLTRTRNTSPPSSEIL